MNRLLLYEIKKIVRRPFTLVVLAGCLAVLAFTSIYAGTQKIAYGWGPQLYGSYENIPPKELERAHSDFGLTGPYDGVLVYSGQKAMELERRYAAPFEGVWDDARLRQMAEDYMAYTNDSSNYSNMLDDWAMMIRQWSFREQGMGDEEIAAYDRANPIYLLHPEQQYGVWQQWSAVSGVLEAAINPDGSVKSMVEAFPLTGQPARYAYHEGPRFTAEIQGVLVGLFALLLGLAGAAPIFSDEVACHTEPILTAAKYGRGKLVRAKLLAGFIFTAAGLLLFTVINVVLTGAVFGFGGYAVPLQLDTATMAVPFSLVYWQYLALIFGLQLLGCCAMAGLIMLLSAAFRSAIPVVFAGGVFIAVALVFANQGAGVLRGLAQILPPGAAVPPTLIREGMENALGTLPLPQWALACIVCAAILAGSAIAVAGKYRRTARV